MTPGEQPSIPKAQPDGPRSSGPDEWHAPDVAQVQEMLPQYDVLEILGRGGMGAVYKARQRTLDRIVAIKILPADTGDSDLDYAERFKNEARAMAKMNHPSIVSVHDFGETSGGQLYFAMEFVEGTDLSHMIKSQGRLPPQRAVAILTEVCDALAYAHARGVIHRDIKPANILIDREGRAKVADFGLAKVDDFARTPALTRPHTTLGTQDFAAPEVFTPGKDPDHRADIYSAGVMLYQMLTGEVPRGLFKMPSEKVAGLDGRFDTIICKAMEQDREDRYAGAAELKRDLVAAAENTTTQERAKPLRWLSGKHAAAAAAMFLLGGVAWFGVGRSGVDPPHTAVAKAPASAPAPWQDVLSAVEPAKCSLAGRWKMENSELFNEPSHDRTQSLCELPVETSGNYDLRVRFTKVHGDDGYVHFGFRKGDHAGDVVFNDRGAANGGNSFVGLGYLDGKAAEKNSVWVAGRSAIFLTPGEKHEVILRVRDEGIAVLLDAVEVYRWTGDWKRLGQQKVFYPETLGRPVFAVGCYNSRIVVHSAGLLPAGEAEGRLLPASPAHLSYDPLMLRPPVLPVLYKGHRYQFVPGQYPWNTANELAARMGGYLATLTDEEEMVWAWRTFSKYLPHRSHQERTSRGWWTGGWQPDHHDPWCWFTGEKFEFASWSEGEPERKGEAPHRVWHHDAGDGASSSWSSLPASHRGGFLVEWDSAEWPAGKPAAATEEEARSVARWVLGLKAYAESSPAALHEPEVYVDDGKTKRRVKKVRELPAGPLQFLGLEIPFVHVDDSTKGYLDIISRMSTLHELRFFAVDDASALACVRNLTGLKLLEFAAPELNPQQMPDALLAHLSRLSALTYLHFEGWLSFTGRTLAVLPQKRKLSTLIVSECPDMNDAGLSAIAQFTGLKTLAVTAGEKVAEAGLAPLETLKSLTTLTVDVPRAGAFDLPGLASLAELPKLENLHLGIHFAGAGLHNVAHLTQLKRLYLQRNQRLTDADLAALAPLKNLYLLRVDGTSINGTGFAALRGMNGEMNLHVEKCPVTEEGFGAIATTFPSLHSLAVSRSSTCTTAAMVGQLARLKNLTRLECQQEFGDDDLHEIARLLGVQSLLLPLSDVTDAGVPHLKMMTGLSGLSLRGTKVTDACVPVLMELKQLKELDISLTKITPEAAARLKAALPGCAIKS